MIVIFTVDLTLWWFQFNNVLTLSEAAIVKHARRIPQRYYDITLQFQLKFTWYTGNTTSKSQINQLP